MPFQQICSSSEDSVSSGPPKPRLAERDEQLRDRLPQTKEGSRTRSHKRPCPQVRPAERNSRLPWNVIVQMGVFYITAVACVVGHLGFFLWLDGQPVSSSGIAQASQSAVANFFAIAVEISILGGIGVAYNQILWRLLRATSLKTETIDTLVTLVMSPWNLWRPDLYKNAALAVLVGIICALVPIAVVFPPGALSVEFQEGVVPFHLKDVPTMNISDFGRGTEKDVTERSFLQLDSSLRWRTSDDFNLFDPRLVSMASRVLASGGPLDFPSPCDGPCSYNISISGPRFHCEELPPEQGLIAGKECITGSSEFGSIVYRAENKVRDERLQGPRSNSFKLSWYPDPSQNECDEDELKTLDCSMTSAQYKVHIDSTTQSRSINVTIGNDEDVWPEDGIPTSFQDEALAAEEGERDPEALAVKFPLAQAYAISRAAIMALAGDIRLVIRAEEGNNEVRTEYTGNGTRIFASPYIGLDNLFQPKFTITADSIQTFLQDLVISTISLSNPEQPLWTNQGDIEAMKGSNVYVFTEKMQFFVPYGACLVVTALIYILGFWSLHRNGVSASKSFLQFAATTSTSRKLHKAAGTSSFGGAENVSQKLRDLRLRFGIHRRAQHQGGTESERCLLLAGFGTESELEDS